MAFFFQTLANLKKKNKFLFKLSVGMDALQFNKEMLKKETVSDLKILAHKGCKIAAQKIFSTKFALLAGFFCYRCYYPHRSRDALSPIWGIFTLVVKTMVANERYLTYQ